MSVGQSKQHSWWEAWMNIFVGFWINYFANLMIFPLFGFHISYEANFLMGIIYTVISLVRSYFLRRAFNKLHVYQHQKEIQNGTTGQTA